MKWKRVFFEFLISTVLPVSISIFYSEVTEDHISELARTIITIILVVVNAVLLYFQYRNTIKEKDDLLENTINSIAYTNSVQLGERKRDSIINKTYDPDYNIPKESVPYDVHNYIAEICKNFRDTISQITHVPQEHMAVTFIYHYTYPNATDSDLSWRWVVGKESSTKTPLDRFVERENSLYHYLITGDNGHQVNSVFCNDKKALAYEGHYFMSARDKDHNKIGSVFAVKVIFGNNAETFVEGILLVSTYGRRFVEGNSSFSKEELKNLLFEGLYPYYQRLLESELGVLYLRHEKHMPN